MNNTQTSFFIRECSKGEMTALPDKAGGRELSRSILQRVATAHESFEQATRRLIRLADLAYGQRDYLALEEISNALAAIPFKPAQDAGRYFAALCLRRAGQYDQAAALLSDLQQPRAVQTLATIYEAKGELDRAARLYSQAAQSSDGFAVAGAIIQVSAIKSLAGDHHAALDDLQRAFPLVRAVARLHPHLWFQYHNEIAVELQAVGELDAARRAVEIAVASPTADCYPEWQETAAELRQAEAARVVVAVVELHREEKRQKAKGERQIVTHHSSRAGGSPVAGIHHSSFRIHQARAPGQPRAPPSFVK